MQNLRVGLQIKTEKVLLAMYTTPRSQIWLIWALLKHIYGANVDKQHDLQLHNSSATARIKTESGLDV